MTRISLGVALLLVACSGQAAPVYSPQAEVMDRLAAVYATRDAVRLAMAWRSMGEFGLPAAEIVESSINAIGYRHLADDDIDTAIAVFELNTETFPRSANAWDSLAEATMAKGDDGSAIRYYRRSLDLDPANRNAARMIARLTGRSQPGLVGGGHHRQVN